jgi:hypothetical protein
MVITCDSAVVVLKPALKSKGYEEYNPEQEGEQQDQRDFNTQHRSITADHLAPTQRRSMAGAAAHLQDLPQAG